ncbi:MAG: hypothetical protein CMF25_02305 [Kangiellaceae bacterium]|nr:hypothetical protein [Kangiellaceae bacterium]
MHDRPPTHWSISWRNISHSLVFIFATSLASLLIGCSEGGMGGTGDRAVGTDAPTEKPDQQPDVSGENPSEPTPSEPDTAPDLEPDTPDIEPSTPDGSDGTPTDPPLPDPVQPPILGDKFEGVESPNAFYLIAPELVDVANAEMRLDFDPVSSIYSIELELGQDTAFVIADLGEESSVICGLPAVNQPEAHLLSGVPSDLSCADEAQSFTIAAGSYLIRFSYDEQTNAGLITLYTEEQLRAKSAANKRLYFVGDFNQWNPSDDAIMFYNDTDGYYEAYITVEQGTYFRLEGAKRVEVTLPAELDSSKLDEQYLPPGYYYLEAGFTGDEFFDLTIHKM